MKKYIIAGFSAYLVLNNGTVVNAADGTPVEQSAPDKVKGIVRLIADSDQDGKYVVGKKYGFEIAALMDVPDEQWTIVEGSEGGTAPVDPAAEAKKKERTELRATIKKLEKAMMLETDKDKAWEIREQWVAASEKLAALGKTAKAPKEEKVWTPEEQALIDLYLGAVEAYNKRKEELDAELAAMRTNLEALVVPEGYKKGKTNDGVDRTGHVGYENAQEIRRLVAEGKMSIKEIADQFNCAPAAVGYYQHYLQHKLRKGDTAYTPLVNKFYPVSATDKNGVEQAMWPEGAPYAEDGIAETNDRYKLPSSRDPRNIKALASIAKELAKADAVTEGEPAEA